MGAKDRCVVWSSSGRIGGSYHLLSQAYAQQNPRQFPAFHRLCSFTHCVIAGAASPRAQSDLEALLETAQECVETDAGSDSLTTGQGFSGGFYADSISIERLAMPIRSNSFWCGCSILSITVRFKWTR